MALWQTKSHLINNPNASWPFETEVKLSKFNSKWDKSTPGGYAGGVIDSSLEWEIR